MNAEQRVHAYKRQAGVDPHKPYVLTPKQRRRVKQKALRHANLEQQGHYFEKEG